MQKTAIEAQVFDTVRDVFGNQRIDIGRETVADDVDGWDSVSHSLFVLALEDRLHIELDFETSLSMENLGELVDFIYERKRDS